MTRFAVAAIGLCFACLAGCGKGKPAPGPAETVDPKDPLFAVALGRPVQTLYCMKGDILVARKAGGRFFLDSVPWREDFSFSPGQQAPADAAEAARLREFRIRELTAAEWDALRKIVTEQKLFERKPVAAGTQGLSKQVLICGAKNVLLGWAPHAVYDHPTGDLSVLLQGYATLNGQPWIAPAETLPADAVDKILVVSVGEEHSGFGDGSVWCLEASRDKDGAWITKKIGAQAIDLSEEANRDKDFFAVPPRYRLTDEEWKGLLDFIRKQDLLHWKGPDIRANDGGDSFVTIRTVVDLKSHWSLGLNQDAKATALAEELRGLYEKQLQKPK